MKYIIKNAIIFAALSFALSVFTGCTTTAPADQSQPGETETKKPTKSDGSAKSNDFPPAPVAVSQAEIQNVDGSTFKVADKKGKVILLNLWATWCGPCRAEMPELNALQDKFRDKDFEIIGLNTDEEDTDEKINQFADEMKLNYTLARSDSKLMNELLKISKFNGIPQSYLIDREGRLRGVFTGGGAKVVNQLKETTEKVVSE